LVQWIHDHARNADSRIDLGSRSSGTTKPLLYQLGIRQLRYLWPIRADEKLTAFVELERVTYEFHVGRWRHNRNIAFRWYGAGRSR